VRGAKARPPPSAIHIADLHSELGNYATSTDLHCELEPPLQAANFGCELNITDKINMHQERTHAKQLQHPNTSGGARIERQGGPTNFFLFIHYNKCQI
jgi:hypothetical protein